ncbi:MAG: helix-turn-helix domain-containing protein [Leptospiraceae bacterium]|nr:helix-turn-helix domain-containing protein [Leptospiraceae bacterium]
MKKESTLDLTPETYRFIEKLGLFHEKYGLPRIGGMIVGLLMISEDALSPEEIARLLGVSRSSISTNLNMLKLVGFLESIRIPGSRKEFIRLSDDGLENSIKVKLNSYSPFEEILQEGIHSIKPPKKVIERIEGLIQYLRLEKKMLTELLDKLKCKDSKLAKIHSLLKKKRYNK